MSAARPARASSTSPARLDLLRLMRRINFGRIEQLPVRDGEPVLRGDAATRVYREVKFGGDNGPRGDAADLSDFALKRQVVELFEQFDALRDAQVQVLVVKHGLPFTMHVETPGGTAA